MATEPVVGLLRSLTGLQSLRRAGNPAQFVVRCIRAFALGGFRSVLLRPGAVSAECDIVPAAHGVVLVTSATYAAVRAAKGSTSEV